MSELAYENLYNSEKKKEFINQYECSESRLTIYWQLLKVAPFERGIDKDISEMTGEEIKLMLLEVGCSTITSAINHINTYKRYADFMTTTSPFYQFESYSELASQVIDKDKNMRYSREELMFMIDELKNDTDKALLLALFEGIKGKSYSEILTLKKDNLSTKVNENGEKIHIAKVYDEGVKDYRDVVISKELFDLLILANKQPSYKTNNEDEEVETPFNESEFIFKKAKKGRQGGTLDRHFINRKFVFFKEFFGNEHLTADDIIQSGMMYLAYTLYKKSGKIGKEELLKVGEQYNTKMATINGKEFYRNITDIKRKVFTDQLEKVYVDLKGIEYSN